MEHRLSRNRDINVVYTIDEPAANGAHQALQAAGKSTSGCLRRDVTNAALGSAAGSPGRVRRAGHRGIEPLQERLRAEPGEEAGVRRIDRIAGAECHPLIAGGQEVLRAEGNLGPQVVNGLPRSRVIEALR